MKKRLFSLLLLLTTATTQADTINKVVFFGDSLTDNGNLYHYLHIIPKSPPYFDGRFTNGPTWAEHFSDYLQKYNVTTENYAVGGSTVILRNPTGGSFPLALSAEILDYRVRSAFQDRSHTLFVIWSGSNDYLDVLTQDPKALVNEVENEIVSDITSLINMGGKSFLIMDIPDLSLTPMQQDDISAARYHEVSELAHLRKIQMISDLKKQYPTYTFAYFDIYDLLTDITLHADKYNAKYNVHIDKIKEPCWPGGYFIKQTTRDDATLVSDLKNVIATTPAYKNMNATAMAAYIKQSHSLNEAYLVGKAAENGETICDNPDEFIFWDHVHPTEVTHKILASLVEDMFIFDGKNGANFKK